MSNLLAVLDQVNAGQELAEEENSPIPEDKLSKVYELWIKKVPISNIARSFNISEATVYRWIDKYKQQFDTLLINKPRSELLLDMIRFTRVVRDVAMSQVHNLDLAAVKVLSNGTRVIDDTLIDMKAKSTFLKIALDAEGKSFEMLQKTGVLPSAVKEIHYSLQETRPIDRSVSNTPTRSRDEMLQQIEALITGGRVMPQLEEVSTNIVMDAPNNE
jgi:hypothetical protein